VVTYVDVGGVLRLIHELRNHLFGCRNFFLHNIGCSCVEIFDCVDGGLCRLSCHHSWIGALDKFFPSGINDFVDELLSR
jgi:hypothetical protein